MILTKSTPVMKSDISGVGENGVCSVILTKSTLVLVKWCLFSDIDEIDSGIGEMASVQQQNVANEPMKSDISGIGDSIIVSGIGQIFNITLLTIT